MAVGRERGAGRNMSLVQGTKKHGSHRGCRAWSFEQTSESAVALGTEHVATERAEAGTDGRALKAATALMADDATDGRAADRTDSGATTGVRTIFTGDEGEGGEEDQNVLFHDVERRR